MISPRCLRRSPCLFPNYSNHAYALLGRLVEITSPVYGDQAARDTYYGCAPAKVNAYPAERLHGGNSNYRDTVLRAAALNREGLGFVDVGSGPCRHGWEILRDRGSNSPTARAA